MAASEGICGVDENNIDVARQLPVLKPIVQDEPSDAAPRQRLALREAVRANPKRDALTQARLQQLDFVARILLSRAIPSPGSRGCALSTIAARQNPDALVFREQALRDPENHRRLTRAAHC